MTGFKQLLDGFVHAHRHSILAGMAQGIQQAAQEDAGLELQPPTGKEEAGDTIKLLLIYQGEATPEQQQQFKQVVQRFSKPGV